MKNLLSLYVFLQTRKASKGQGIVEYAGALVVAAAIVAAVLGIAPNALGTLFDTIVNTIATMLTTEIQSV